MGEHKDKTANFHHRVDIKIELCYTFLSSEVAVFSGE